MRVLHITTCLDTGGAEASLYKLIKHFGDHDFDHVVCSLNGRGTFGPKIETLGSPVFALSGRPLELAWTVPRMVRHVRPDVVQGWMYHGNLAASWSRFLGATHAPVLWNIRQSLYDLGVEKRMTALIIQMEQMLSRFPCRIIYNSYAAAKQHNAFGYCSARNVIIPNGFDTDLFKPDLNARRLIRKEIGVDEDAPLIGLIGRHHPMKDHANFLDSACLIKAAVSSAVFLLAGRDTAKALPQTGLDSIAGSVKVLGERDDIPSIMAALDVAVLASAYGEAFPNVIGEAMACGVPCVATDVGDARRVIGDTGYVVPPRAPQALASAVLSLLDRQDRHELGERARRRIVSEFSAATTAATYRDLYKEVLES